MVDNELLSHRACNVRPQVAIYQRERQIDSRGHSRGGPHGPIVDKDSVIVDSDLRKSRLQFTRMTPMSRRRPTIERSRFRQHEGTGAYGSDSAKLPDTVSNIFHQARSRRWDDRSATDNQRVELDAAECVGAHHHPGRRPNWAACFG